MLLVSLLFIYRFLAIVEFQLWTISGLIDFSDQVSCTNSVVLLISLTCFFVYTISGLIDFSDLFLCLQNSGLIDFSDRLTPSVVLFICLTFPCIASIGSLPLLDFAVRGYDVVRCSRSCLLDF